jgi:hypothetical protein
MLVDLSIEELRAFRKAAFAVRELAEVLVEVGAAALESGDRKLATAIRGTTCVHCGERESKRRDRICERCNAYRAKYPDRGLPSEETLIASGRRTLERRAVGARPPNRSKSATGPPSRDDITNGPLT